PCIECHARVPLNLDAPGSEHGLEIISDLERNIPRQCDPIGLSGVVELVLSLECKPLRPRTAKLLMLDERLKHEIFESNLANVVRAHLKNQHRLVHYRNVRSLLM